mmetsp:Transcript_81068/g.255747  ORF Transcript_81068/g.255747 Transcript_81068/m.255747 type:complete len:260 (+) Transcript_81068:959-1738(+)
MRAVARHHRLLLPLVGEVVQVRVEAVHVGVDVMPDDVLDGPEMVLDVEGADVAADRVHGRPGGHGKVAAVVHEVATREPVQQREVDDGEQRPPAPLPEGPGREGEANKVLGPCEPCRLAVGLHLVVRLVAARGEVPAHRRLDVRVQRGALPVEEATGAQRRLRWHLHLVELQSFAGDVGEGVVGLEELSAVDPAPEVDRVSPSGVVVDKGAQVVSLAVDDPHIVRPWLRPLPLGAGGRWGGVAAALGHSTGAWPARFQP